MLRNILLSTVFVAAAGSAVAADLPYRTAAPAPAYVQAMPMFTWTGFYVGLNAGGAWNDGRSLSSTGFVAPNPIIFGNSNGSNDDIGFTGGAQIGYNMQFGNFVAGVEADINYLDRNGGGSGAFPAIAPAAPDFTDFAVGSSNGGNWFGTVRGRLGFAFDRALIYGTGGLAYGGRLGTGSIIQRDYDSASGVATVVDLASTGGNSKRFGWTLGAGMEYAFTNSMSFKIEYMHVNMGNSSRTYDVLPAANVAGTTTGAETITVRNNNKFDVVRAGVNFRF